MNVLFVQACICLGPAICLFSPAHIQQRKSTQRLYGLLCPMFLFLLLQQIIYIEMKWLLTPILSEFKWYENFVVSDKFWVVNWQSLIVPIIQKSNKFGVGHVKGISL